MTMNSVGLAIKDNVMAQVIANAGLGQSSSKRTHGSSKSSSRKNEAIFTSTSTPSASAKVFQSVRAPEQNQKVERASDHILDSVIAQNSEIAAVPLAPVQSAAAKKRQSKVKAKLSKRLTKAQK